MMYIAPMDCPMCGSANTQYLKAASDCLEGCNNCEASWYRYTEEDIDEIREDGYTVCPCCHETRVDTGLEDGSSHPDGEQSCDWCGACLECHDNEEWMTTSGIWKSGCRGWLREDEEE